MRREREDNDPLRYRDTAIQRTDHAVNADQHRGGGDANACAYLCATATATGIDLAVASANSGEPDDHIPDESSRAEC